MVNRIAILALAAAALGAGALPRAAAAADYYDGGGRSFAFRTQDDIRIDGDHARVLRSQEFRPDGRPRHPGPGPVVYDERGPRYGGPDDGYRGPPPGRPPFGFERPAAYGPRFGSGPGGDEGGYGYAPPPPRQVYRPVSAPVGPAYDEAYDGGPDVGCTVEQAQSTTPAGWRKTVTHRTCYRR